MDQSLAGADVCPSFSILQPLLQCTDTAAAPNLMFSVHPPHPHAPLPPGACAHAPPYCPIRGGGGGLLRQGSFPLGHTVAWASLTGSTGTEAAMQLLPALCGLLPRVPTSRDIFQTETLPAIKGPRHRIRQGVRRSAPSVTSQDSFPQAP